MNASKRVEGLTAIVTAGGQGIGEAISKTLAREGARVAVADRNVGEATRVVAEITAAGGTAIMIEIDATKAASVARMVEITQAKWGAIDILVNGAGGFTRFATIADISEEEWDDAERLERVLRGAFGLGEIPADSPIYEDSSFEPATKAHADSRS